MRTVIVAGASRGLGLEFARQYAVQGWRVIATSRAPERDYELLKVAGESEIDILTLDTGLDRSVSDFRAALGDIPVELVICSAGVNGGAQQKLGEIDFEVMAQTFNINCAGPVRLAQALVGNLAMADEPKLIAIGSRMGSIAETTGSDMMIYRTSKAALNAAWNSLAHELKPLGIALAVLHPGWVATDMGGPDAPLNPEASVAGMRGVIDALALEETGAFRTFDGERLPW